MSIGQRISELRKSNALSQEYVAERLGVTRQAVSKWETNQSAPDTYNLIALAELFGVSVEYIATGKQPEQLRPPELQQPDIHTTQSHGKFGMQKIIGFILLGAGLFSLILAVLLSEILLFLSVYLIVGGILCLALRRNVGLVTAWTFWGMTLLTFSILTRINLFSIFTEEIRYFAPKRLFLHKIKPQNNEKTLIYHHRGCGSRLHSLLYKADFNTTFMLQRTQLFRFGRSKRLRACC